MRDREAKRAYKQAFEALQKAKVRMEASAGQEEALRRDLLDAFDSRCEAKVQPRPQQLYHLRNFCGVFCSRTLAGGRK